MKALIIAISCLLICQCAQATTTIHTGIWDDSDGAEPIIATPYKDAERQEESEQVKLRLIGALMATIADLQERVETLETRTLLLELKSPLFDSEPINEGKLPDPVHGLDELRLPTTK
jgi:hypothetical protein